MRREYWVVVLAVSAGFLSGCRATPQSAPPAPRSAANLAADAAAIEEGRSIFYRLVAGENELPQRCEDHWTRVHRERPDSPLATAYLGATLCYRASLERWPPRKGELIKRGLGLLETAVTAAPDDVEVRFLRGITSRRLPAFIGRGDVARSDLAYAANAAPAAVASGQLDARIASAALYHYGAMCAADGNRPLARRAWQEAARLGPDTPAGRRALRLISQSN